MKIIAGNYFAKNIQFVCECCNCVYEVESKEDWTINYVLSNNTDFHTYYPEYHVKCPNCGHDVFIGYDSDDCEEFKNIMCPRMDFLKRRKDWKGRYKVEPKYKD